MDIWDEVKDKIRFSVLSGTLVRVVESQEQIATNQLVDSLEAQIQLEELLEQSKPRYNTLTAGNKKLRQKKLSYLLITPFRYPPLIHGSRFGTRFEASLFYASKTVSTAFSETAYYRFYFWAGMKKPPPSKKYITEHLTFKAKYYTQKGLLLTKPPFSQYETALRDPSQYHVSQILGKKMRENKVGIFEYVSARDSHKGTNVALFSADGFAGNKPYDQQHWLCETTENKVCFSSKEGLLFSYHKTAFLVNNALPIPAA